MRITASQSSLNRLYGPMKGLVALWPWALGIAAALVAGLQPPFVSAAILVAVVGGLLLLKYPVLGAYTLVLSVPVQKAVSYDAGPLEITVTQVMFVVVLGVWWAWLMVRRDRHLELTPIAVTMLLFFVATL